MESQSHPKASAISSRWGARRLLGRTQACPLQRLFPFVRIGRHGAVDDVKVLLKVRRDQLKTRH